MELSEIIRSWHRLALGETIDRHDVFFRFVAIWVAFNALYASRHYSDFGDWDQVRSFAGDPDAVDQHRHLLENDPVYTAGIDTLARNGVLDLKTSGRRKIRDKRNLTKVLSCIYQVRCNLFHGGKTPENPRDAALVSASYEVILRLIGPMIDLGNFESEA